MGYESTDFFATPEASGDYSSFYDTAIPQSYLDFGSVPSGPSYSGGNYASTDFFPKASLATDGAALIDSRSNTSFWNVDQSKIPASLQNVFGSLTEAAVKSGVQVASSTINRGTQQNGVVGGFFKNFRSTSTGAQINAGAYSTQIQNFFYNPIVWFAAVGLVVLLFVMKRG
jgi:hypothetical protein